MSINCIIPIILAIILGQVVRHLNKKMPPVVSEEITYKEFFSTLKYDFKIDIKYTLILLLTFGSHENYYNDLKRLLRNIDMDNIINS